MAEGVFLPGGGAGGGGGGGGASSISTTVRVAGAGTELTETRFSGNVDIGTVVEFADVPNSVPVADTVKWIRFNCGRAHNTVNSAYAGEWHEMSKEEWDALTVADAGSLVAQNNCKLYREFIDANVATVASITTRDSYLGKDAEGKPLIAGASTVEDYYPITFAYEHQEPGTDTVTVEVEHAIDRLSPAGSDALPIADDVGKIIDINGHLKKSVPVHTDTDRAVTWGDYTDDDFVDVFATRAEANTHAADNDLSDDDFVYIAGIDAWLVWDDTAMHFIQGLPPDGLILGSPFRSEEEASRIAGAVDDVAVWDGTVNKVTAIVAGVGATDPIYIYEPIDETVEIIVDRLVPVPDDWVPVAEDVASIVNQAGHLAKVVPELIGVHGQLVTWGDYAPTLYVGEFVDVAAANRYLDTHLTLANNSFGYVFSINRWIVYIAASQYFATTSAPTGWIPGSPFNSEEEASLHANALDDISAWGGNVSRVTAFTAPSTGSYIYHTEKLLRGNPVRYWYMNGQTAANGRVPLNTVQPYTQTPDVFARVRMQWNGDAAMESHRGGDDIIGDIWVDGADVSADMDFAVPVPATENVVFTLPIGTWNLKAWVRLGTGADTVEVFALSLLKATAGVDDIAIESTFPVVTNVSTQALVSVEVKDLVVDGTEQFYWVVDTEQTDELSFAGYFRIEKDI